MRRIFPALMGLIFAAGLPASAAERRIWTARYPLPDDGRLTVENVQGDIHVDAWDTAEVEITVIKTALGPASRLDDVRIAFEFGDRALSVRTVYPPDSGDPVRVDYHLRVPRRARLESLRTVQGNIGAENTEGPVDARTLYGSIAQVNVAGRVVARSINGDIKVSLSDVSRPAVPITLDTVNGNLELVLPAGADADLELSTVAGKIEGAYVFAAARRPADWARRARLGRGGPRVRLRTVRGDIRVRQRGD